jgi:hypothetical protein
LFDGLVVTDERMANHTSQSSSPLPGRLSTLKPSARNRSATSSACCELATAMK